MAEGEKRQRRADDEVVSAWHDLLALHAHLTFDLDRALQPHGLGTSDFEVLDRLVAAGDRIRMHQLAEAVHLSQSALSRLVSRLEREGLLSRTMCADDRRGIFVWLTDAGRLRHAAALPGQRAVLAAYLGATPGTEAGAGASAPPTGLESRPAG